MNNNNLIQKWLFSQQPVRGAIVKLTDVYQTIVDQHDYPCSIKHPLGEILAAVCLLSASIKFKGRLTIQFQGGKNLKLLLAQCNHLFEIRGLAQWQGQMNDVQQLIAQLKQGILAITIDPQDSVGKQYQGIVAWQGESFAESLEGYFYQSEQLPTRIWLAVDDQQAAGMLVQMMPSEMAEDSLPEWQRICQLTTTLTSAILLNENPQTMLQYLYPQDEIQLFPAETVQFRCTCSVERSRNALLLLGKEEVEQELKEKQQVVVTCEFCGEEFAFDRDAATDIFNRRE